MPLFQWYAHGRESVHGHTYYIRWVLLFNKRHTSNKGFAACWPTNRHATRTYTILIRQVLQDWKEMSNFAILN